MTAAILFLVITIILISIHLLHLASQAMPPALHFTDSKYIRTIIAMCPMLRDQYVPTSLWGKNGHLQTILYGKMGRINSPFPRGERHSAKMPDGATMTFDIFQPHLPHKSDGDYTLCVCPGIANSSESLYIRTFVHHAQTEGFRVAVLNHLGALKDVRLTSSRIFTYGGTDEYSTMIDRVLEIYPDTSCIAVGFSMGGNIITKYLGESKENQAKVLCGVSCGQGYDVEKAVTYLMSWENFRRCYIWAMAQHMKSILQYNYDILFGQANDKYDTKQIFSGTSLLDIDTHYSSKRAGFNSVADYYKWVSCSHYMDNIEIPMFFLNAQDDPLVPPELINIPKEFASKRNNVIVVETRHGGHLGYFQGGVLIPDTITWLDKVVVEFAHAIVLTSTAKQNGKLLEMTA